MSDVRTFWPSEEQFARMDAAIVKNQIAKAKSPPNRADWTPQDAFASGREGGQSFLWHWAV